MYSIVVNKSVSIQKQAGGNFFGGNGSLGLEWVNRFRNFSKSNLSFFVKSPITSKTINTFTYCWNLTRNNQANLD